MLNKIWGGMMVVAILSAVATGKIGELGSSVLTGAQDAVTMTISLAGIMCFWTGIMKIAENTGVTSFIAKLLSPVIQFLFPGICDKEAKNAIVMNMTANMLGMSNAATPLGLKAMEKLNKYSDSKNATDHMCMFAVINTASIQLIPSTLIALRQGAGARYPAEIIPAVWICSVCAITVGVFAAKISKRLKRC